MLFFLTARKKRCTNYKKSNLSVHLKTERMPTKTASFKATPKISYLISENVQQHAPPVGKMPLQKRTRKSKVDGFAHDLRLP